MLRDIKSKLKAVDRIEKNINIITAKVSELDVRVTDIDQRVTENESASQFISSKYEESAHELKTLKQNLSSFEKKCKSLQAQKEKTEEKLVDLEIKSMRDNLVFYGVPEASTDQPEDCTKAVNDVINNILDITGQCTLDSAYRPARRGQRQNDRPRPIIARFHYGQERERVRTASFNQPTQQRMKEKGIGIGPQLPKDVRDARKPLYDAMRRAKDDRKEVKFVGKTLYIDGTPYKPPAGGE